MKTLKKLLLTGIMTMMLFACEDMGEIPPESSKLPPSNFEAVFSGKNHTITPYVVSACGNAFRHEFRGEGDSNLLGAFTIVKRYCFSGKSAATHSYVDNGEFTLVTKAQSDTIVGTYDGDISIHNGYSNLLEKFTITGGTGKYQNASGYLTVNTTGREELYGNIRGRIQLEPPLDTSNDN